MIVIYFLLMMIPIVIIHELGHYYVGRLAGIPAEAFSVGFGKPIYTYKDRRGTEWRLSPIPLGGYVRFGNDANGTGFPNLDTKKSPYLAPFFGKLSTILAGPFANFVFSFVLFTFFASFNGLPGQSTVISNVSLPGVLQAGDQIDAVGNVPIENIDAFYELAIDQPTQIPAVIIRDNSRIDVALPNPTQPYVLFMVPGSPAQTAGLREGDLIIALDDRPVITTAEVIEYVRAQGAVPIDVTIARARSAAPDPNIETLAPRDDQTGIYRLKIMPDLQSDDVPRIGASLGVIYATQDEPRSLLEAMDYALGATLWVVTQSLSGLHDLFVGDVSVKALSGPVGIANLAQDAAAGGFWQFIQYMALFSSAIGFMNLLPIPILDGGHVVLMSYERVFGRLPPQFVLNFLFMLGIALLLGVLILTTTNELITN